MTLSRRAYWKPGDAASWEELWDAAQYFDRVADLLEDAQRWVVIVGWQLDSRLLLRKPARPPEFDASQETLRQKILRLCTDRPSLRFYLLLWDHPTLYIPQREWLQNRVWEELHPHVHLVFDNRHPFGASHHEKLVAVDGKVILTGGVDLCADRWDTTSHAVHDNRRSLGRKHEAWGPYHELGVQVTGPVCGLIHHHIRRRWRKLSTIPFPDDSTVPRETGPNPAVSGDTFHRVWVSRTHSSIDAGDAPRPIVREIEFLFRQLIREADSEIWIEGQYFWSRHVQESLLQRIEVATSPLRITIILADLSHLKFLPARMAWYQAHLLAGLERAVKRNHRLVVLRVFRPMSGHRPIYVHSKLLLVDDHYASIGSANFSGRALRMDSELMLTFEARHPHEHTRLRRLLRMLEEHWSHATLVPVDSLAEEDILRRRAPILSRLAWQKLLDPELPYFHRSKRRIFAKLERRATRSAAEAVAFSLSWLIGFLPVTAMMARDASREGPTAWILAALLFSVWIVPIPFLALVIITAVQFEVETAARVVLAAWWMAGAITLLWGRSFPTILRRWTDKHSPRPIRAFGRRRFSEVLRAWFDPRFSTHEKLLWQSRYWVPVPWLILIQGLILGSALLWLIRWTSGALGK